MSLSKNNSTLLRVYEDASPLIDKIHWAILFVIMPGLAVLGISGNSLSLVVLYRQGFKKSSNILLFALAISDILFLVGTTSPARAIYAWERGHIWYPEKEARIFFYIYQACDYINWCAGPMSMTIPVLITAERFVAVFFPLQFKTIVTARRTFIATMFLVLIFYVPQLYLRLWFKFIYVWDPARNVSVGLSARTDRYWNDLHLAAIFGLAYGSIGYFVFIVGTGSLAIGIRISLAAAQRRRLVSGDGGRKTRNTGKEDSAISNDVHQTPVKLATPSRTTKMLLALCVFYTISCTFVVMPNFFPQYWVWPLFTPNPNFRSVELFRNHLLLLNLCMNASCNFVIYVVMNKNFRNTFLQIFGRGKNTVI